MTVARGEAAPLRFLLGVVLAWTALRGAMLIGWQPGGGPLHWGPRPGTLLERWPAPIAARPTPPAIARARLAGVPRRFWPADLPAAVAEAWRAAEEPLRIGATTAVDPLRLIALAGYDPRYSPGYPRASGQGNAAALAGAPAVAAAPGRWSGSAWLFLRDGGGGPAPLAPVGRIGGGQAGARVLYRIDDGGRLAAAARLSRSIDGPRQTEAAVGIDWMPVRGLHLTAERRVAIDRGGRDAFALGAAGGVYALPVAKGWRLDGFAEAGMVGLSRRDPYGDGAVRIGRELAVGPSTLTVGGGVWGAAQPGARRLDIGPSAVLRVPVAERTVALAADWRERVAGDARPGSGPALTVGIDF